MSEREDQKGFGRQLNGRILVVDDELPNRLYLRKLLRSRGCTVYEAAGAEAAIKLAREQRPELILADVMMPGMDGFELCRVLKADSLVQHIPVILVTAKSKIDDIETGFVQGAMDYIRKPFNPRELLLRVGNALDLHRSKEALTLWKSRVSHELKLAGAMQHSIFDVTPMFTERFEIRVAYQPCMDVGGDIFDLIELPSGELCVYIGDVSGHGVAPAMISSFLKATISELVRQMQFSGPAEICNQIHSRFLRTVGEASYYATFFMAIFDPQIGRWRCMNCGHPNPLVMENGQSVHEDLFSQGGGVPIGFSMASEKPYCETDEVYLEAKEGSHIVFYTDGITEATHAETGEDCGIENFADAVRAVTEDKYAFNKSAAILKRLSSLGYKLNEDDSTAICIYMNRAREILYDKEVPVTTDAVVEMASQVEKALLGIGWPECSAGACQLMAIEHGMNVVEHGGAGDRQMMHLQLLARDGVCKMIFKDAGREWDVVGAANKCIQADDMSTSGRGVAIINALAEYHERYRANNANVCFYVFNKELDCK
jgi:sigma-B regulation protein RsbU (phosphoserine phosphatase)